VNPSLKVGNFRADGPAQKHRLRALIVRWALARIRERPAYAQLRERIQQIAELKAQF